MQISRHWRMNPQRYRLQGVRYTNGEVSLQSRPQPVTEEVRETVNNSNNRMEKVSFKVAS